MKIQDQLEKIELIDLITDCIEHKVPYLCIEDANDRETILFLPEPQTAGTEYQKATYALKAAEKLANSFFLLEGYEEEYSIYEVKNN